MVKGSSRYTNSIIDNQALTIPAGGNLTTQSTGASSIPASHINLDAPHNYLNLPNKFDFGSNNTIDLLYDGLGNKLRKTVKTSGTTTITQDYLGGIELKNNVVEAVYNEEGRAFNNGGTFRYEYVLRDHLGNTRVVFSDKNGSGTIDHTEILGKTHYYPFGKAFDGAWYNDATAGKYRYLYNGKELSEEFDLNFYDYGARWLDPGLGSWWEVDPASELSRRWSPYAYGNNNPIRFIDPDGRESSAYGGFTSSAEMAAQHAAASERFVQKAQDDDKKKSKSKEEGPGLLEDGGPVHLAFTTMNELNPLAIGVNSIKAYLTGTNVNGEAMSSGEATFNLATILPVGKFAKLGKVGVSVAKSAYYSVAYEMRLANNLYPGKGYYSHFKAANTALSNAMSSDAAFAKSMTELGISVPVSPTGNILGTSPANWVWHHNIESGVMQLVPKAQHSTGSTFWNILHPGGLGGMSIWGNK
ncbi:RHS repeat-associated core domain-containing protein [Dyadobacter tibetensis]|uniref:RHS repeat-associated core domain-containing protein n=1 Tax=Dyadobacter tibetensis TaxID=1211851 RepID=UPI00046EDFCC|nr:RHS repeat-associated core domain-containing protein [Dyadobacter tibetensis]